jgi:hypothetical protein
MMMSILVEDQSDYKGDACKPEPVSTRGTCEEIVGTDMRYDQIEDRRPEEMCEIEIHEYFGYNI